MIPDDEVERVREAADIVGIIGEYVTLKRVGSTFRGPCPFHQGTHRNFSVEPRRKIFHCFVCSEGGDVFTFLQKRLGVDWPTAVRMTAQKMGIELHEVSSRRDGPDPREPLWEVNASAKEFFSRMLWDDERGEPACAYLAEREISREVADRFGLGFAPREGGLLRAHLSTLGFDDARQLEAGVLVRSDGDAEPRPRFRARLIFPIIDAGGHVAGFGGRLLGPGEPKYLNSSESATFAKGKLLYGLSWARTAIRLAERVILVEGYFDLVRLCSQGVEEVVAPLGTALTSDQAELITRQSKDVFLLYDSDRAGLKATFRAGEELLRHGATVRVVSLPAGDDPDTFVRAHGKGALEKQIAQALDIFERKIQLLSRGAWFTDLHRRRRAIDYLLPTIRAASDPVTRDMYIGRAAEASGVERRVLADEASRTQSPRASRVVVPKAVAADTGGATSGQRLRQDQPAQPVPGGAAERELVRAMLAVPATIERISERIGPQEFRDARYREIFEVLSERGQNAHAEDVAAVLSEKAAEAYGVLLAETDAIRDIERTVQDCLSQLEERLLRERNASIRTQLAVARESEKDELLKEQHENKDEIRRLTESRIGR